MKRYEKMSREEIIEGMMKTQGECWRCLLRSRCSQLDESTCIFAYKAWLNEEPVTLPRVATINTKAELTKAIHEWVLSDSDSLCDWLAEDIEVE